MDLRELVAGLLGHGVLAQPEQLAHELQRGMPAGAAVLILETAQADRRLVQQPRHHRSCDRLDTHGVARRRSLPAAGVLGQDLLHDRVAVLAQGRDRRQGIELAQPACEAPDLLLDDLVRARRLLGARGEVAGDDRLEVVDVVQRHPFELAAGGVDVARHRDVDQQQRPLPALGHHQLELLSAHDRVGRGGRAEHDVGREQLVGQFVQPDDRPAEAFGQAQRAVGVAVGDEDRARALLGESPCGQLAGLAGAQDHDVALLEIAEDALREIDRDRRHADAARADRGFRADALARPQRGCEQAVGQRTARPGADRGLVRTPHLPLDLGLADDHRLQPRGDAVQLARGVAVAR